MKNLLIVFLLVVVVIVGYMTLTSRMRMNLAGLEGKTTTVTRGDLTLPINATGEIKPLGRHVIKSEASGEVIEIAARPGERVSAGDLIIRLQRDDEERNVNRAKGSLVVAKAAWEEAKSILEQAKTADIAAAQAAVVKAKAILDVSKIQAVRAEEDPELYHEEERITRVAAYQSDKAQVAISEANLDKARLAVGRAEQAVIRMEANRETAKNNLGDAEKQLAKTRIVAPVSVIVAQVNVQIGEVIQGGKQNFGGGTTLAVLLNVNRLILQAEVDEADIGRMLKLAPSWAIPGHSDTERMPDDLAVAVSQVDRLATIKVETFPDTEFTGIIERIYPEPKTIANVTTYLVDVVIVSEEKGMLLPGMRAEIEFTSEHLEGVVLCSTEAIKPGPDGNLGVYVPRDDALPNELPYRFVPVKIGLSDGSKTHIRQGLTEGMVVYTKLPIQPISGSRKKGRKE